MKNSNFRGGELDYSLDIPNKKLAEKFTIMHKAKFCIAMENSYVTDYVSEKIWEALTCGCVPIYLGDFNKLERVLPQPIHEMVLSMKDFDYNVDQLMGFLLELVNNDYKYDKYLEWKNKPPMNQYNLFREEVLKDQRKEMCEMVFNYKNAVLVH